MSDFVTLTCPSCGGKLKVTSDIERFACAHCGTEHIVKRGDGIIALSPVLNAIAGVKSSVDILANDVLLRRAKEAKAQLDQEIEEIWDSLDDLHDKNSKTSIKRLKSNVRSGKIQMYALVTFAILGTVLSLTSFRRIDTCAISIIGFVWLLAVASINKAKDAHKRLQESIILEQDLSEALSSKQQELEKQEQKIATL